MITRREAERLCKSFLGDNSPPRLPDNFAFEIVHDCAWGCRGQFVPGRYNSSRAKCIKCSYCAIFFSPNKVGQEWPPCSSSANLFLQMFSASVRVPLAPAGGGREVRAAGRRQLQLVAAPHPAAGRPAGRGGAQLGGRQGHVQRRHAQEDDVQQQPAGRGVPAPRPAPARIPRPRHPRTRHHAAMQTSQARGKYNKHSDTNPNRVVYRFAVYSIRVCRCPPTRACRRPGACPRCTSTSPASSLARS